MSEALANLPCITSKPPSNTVPINGPRYIKIKTHRNVQSTPRIQPSFHAPRNPRRYIKEVLLIKGVDPDATVVKFDSMDVGVRGENDAVSEKEVGVEVRLQKRKQRQLAGGEERVSGGQQEGVVEKPKGEAEEKQKAQEETGKRKRPRTERERAAAAKGKQR